MLSYFITITKKRGCMLDFQFSGNPEFERVLKIKVPPKYRKFIEKERDKFFQEIEREIFYYEVNKMYWGRIFYLLHKYFKKVFIIKGGKTFIVTGGKLRNIANDVKTKDENIYIEDYYLKKYKVYRDR